MTERPSYILTRQKHLLSGNQSLIRPWALKPRDFLIYIRRSKGEKKHINKPLLNEPSFIVIDFYRTLNGIINQSINL